MVATKSSGIAWIGEIPIDWELNKIKYISTLKGRIGWQGLTSDEYTDEGAYLITGTDFDNGCINWETCVHVPMKRWEEAKDIQIENGDLLITKDGTVGKVAIVDGLDSPCSLNSGVLRISTTNGYDRRFLYWVLQSEVFWTWFSYKNVGNSTILHLYQGDFAEFNYAIPPLTEQQAIAAFLDDRCGQIDGIVADLERQVEILRQYKKALITETATQGLDKTTPMKDSEIDWIGEMPKHWNVKRLRYVCRLKTGTTPSENEGINIDEVGLNWFTPSDFSPSLTLETSEKYVSPEAIRRFKITPYPAGSVLLVAIGATVGKIGYCEVPAYSNQQITALMPYAIRGKYLMYFLHSKTDYIKDNALYTTLPIINNTYLSDIFVCVPSDTEQADIIEFLDRKCAETDDLITEKQKAAETMRQYKKSLIYEYVTGKKRVAG